jgi:hypothetical protein
VCDLKLCLSVAAGPKRITLTDKPRFGNSKSLAVSGDSGESMADMLNGACLR